jgi:hypothetical protein
MDYFRSCTWQFSLIFILFYFLLNLIAAGNSFFLSFWSTSSSSVNNSNNNTSSSTGLSQEGYLGIYTALGILQCLFQESWTDIYYSIIFFLQLDLIMFFGDLAFIRMIMKSSRLLHNQMLNSILHSNMQFFESTPIGRIINRFSE